jgi:hypothetical protein
MGVVDPGSLPKPPRIPRAMPEPAVAGWWVSPGLDPRVLRYHDGSDWTNSICRLGLRGPGPIEHSPFVDHTSPEPTDPEIAALPKPPRFPLGFSWDLPKAGWWAEPDGGLRTLKRLRYYDGHSWTDFVCELGLHGPGEITRMPRPPNHR